MAQSNYVISNTTASSVRSQINDAFEASVTLNSGIEPTTTYAGMLWHNPNNHLLRIRNDADDAWISVAYVDQDNERWSIIRSSRIVTSSGTEVGQLDVQSETAWETGTSTVESIVSPAKIKAALNGYTGFNSSQSWSDETSSRAFGTDYTNNTGNMIQVSVTANGFYQAGPDSRRSRFTISSLVGGVTISETVAFAASAANNNHQNLTFNVPNGSTYRVNQVGNPSVEYWSELR